MGAFIVYNKKYYRNKFQNLLSYTFLEKNEELFTANAYRLG